MAQFRTGRVSHDVQREITDIMRQLKDPRISGLLSIVKVNVTNDFSYADVYVSSMEGFAAAQEAVKGLKSAAGFIRRELSHRMKLRKTPELRFIADDSIAKSAEIGRILDDIKPQD